jgi:hypothetical protein
MGRLLYFWAGRNRPKPALRNRCRIADIWREDLPAVSLLVGYIRLSFLNACGSHTRIASRSAVPRFSDRGAVNDSL